MMRVIVMAMGTLFNEGVAPWRKGGFNDEARLRIAKEVLMWMRSFVTLIFIVVGVAAGLLVRDITQDDTLGNWVGMGVVMILIAIEYFEIRHNLKAGHHGGSAHHH